MFKAILSFLCFSLAIAVRHEVDFVVVGSGPGGSTTASVLSRDSNAQVVLLEAADGELHKEEDLQEIGRCFEAVFAMDSVHPTAKLAEPLTRSDAPPLYITGEHLGGGSSVNCGLWFRGTALDFDNWNLKGWAHKDFEKAYLRIEEFRQAGGKNRRGTTGAVTVQDITDSLEDSPRREALYKVLRNNGYPMLEDYNSFVNRTNSGFFEAQHSMDFPENTRESAVNTMLEPANRLEILTSSRAVKVLFENQRAIGVEYINVKTQETHTVFARKEVIVATGAFGTPHLLMLSGIGPASQLKEHGIDLVVDVPGVGVSLSDQVGTVLYGRYGEAAPAPRKQNKAVVSDSLIVLGNLDNDATKVPTYEILIYPDEPFNSLPLLPGALVTDAAFLAVLLHPSESGSVRLKSADPLEKPAIQFGFYEDERDLAAMTKLIDHIRYDLMPDFGMSPVWPMADMSSRDAALAVVLFFSHPSSTCKMGNDWLSVVDTQLRVKGVTGLRVADTSVLPKVISGHTQAPAYVVGLKCAEFLLEEHYGHSKKRDEDDDDEGQN